MINVDGFLFRQTPPWLRCRAGGGVIKARLGSSAPLRTTRTCPGTEDQPESLVLQGGVSHVMGVNCPPHQPLSVINGLVMSPSGPDICGFEHGGVRRGAHSVHLHYPVKSFNR